MDIKTERMISSLMTELKIDTDSDIKLAEFCFIINLIDGLTKEEGYLGLKSQLGNHNFISPLKKYKVDFFIPFDDVDDAIIKNFDDLFELLRTNDLLETKKFLSYFSPWIVMDWARFDGALNKRKVLTKLVALIFVLKCSTMFSSMDALLEMEPDKFYDEHEALEEYWSGKLRLTKEKFAVCWSATYYIKLQGVSVSVRGHIASAINEYRNHYIPLAKLLSDVLDVKTYLKDRRDKKGKKIKIKHPWAYVQTAKGISYERGLTVAEELFEKSAFSLKDKLPTDIIRAAYYPKSRNDSAFECSFLPKLFPTMTEDMSVLIVNPSPDFILLWESKEKICDTTYAVTDETVAGLYKTEFPERQFVPISDIEKVKYAMDYVLVICRDLPDDILKTALSILSFAKDDSQIYAVLPNALFDSSRSYVSDMLRQTGCYIKDILLLPTKATKSSPRKKLLVRFAKRPEPSDKPAAVTMFSSGASGEKSEIRMLVLKEHCQVSHEELLHGTQTVHSLQKRAAERRKPRAITVRRQQPERYEFSREVCINYTIQSERKGRFAGKAYYCAIARDDEPRRQKGKRLTEIIEKGLRAKTKEEVLSNLEWVAFDDRVAKHIVDDILSFYDGRLEEVSVKTLWFCCRDVLLRNKSYDEEFAKYLFCGENRELADLCLNTTSEVYRLDEEASFFKTEPMGIQLKCWRTLDLIIDTAVKQKYRKFNHVTGVVRKYSDRATKEQQEVRNALVKKTLSLEEEEKILQYICADTDIQFGSRAAKRYEADSHYLAGAIRFFTGMSVKELCALTWADFKKVYEKDLYQFWIRKFATSDGHIDRQPRQNDWVKFRRVPIAPALLQMLLARKKYLQIQNPCSQKEFNRQPIVLPKEYCGTRCWNENDGYCTYKVIAAKCNEIVASANIPEQIITLPGEDNQRETDIFKYFGDIYQSNFKYRANHTCALRRGEINYILGIEPPDTFSRNYCDYTNDLIQYMMSQKLQRWSALHPALSASDKEPYSHSAVFRQQRKEVFGPVAGGVVSVDMQLELEDCAGGVVEIETDCNFGCSGSVTLFSEGGESNG